MENIEFYPLIGYYYDYEISKCGQIRRRNFGKDKRIPKYRKAIPSIGSHGYYQVGLKTKNGIEGIFLLHRLLCITFIPNSENKRTINHKNGIKTDNRLENLEWATHQENNIHARDVGLNNSHCEKSPHAKLKNSEVLEIRKLLESKTLMQTEIAKMFGVHPVTIHDIKTNKHFKRL